MASKSVSSDWRKTQRRPWRAIKCFYNLHNHLFGHFFPLITLCFYIVQLLQFLFKINCCWIPLLVLLVSLLTCFEIILLHKKVKYLLLFRCWLKVYLFVIGCPEAEYFFIRTTIQFLFKSQFDCLFFSSVWQYFINVTIRMPLFVNLNLEIVPVFLLVSWSYTINFVVYNCHYVPLPNVIVYYPLLVQTSDLHRAIHVFSPIIWEFWNFINKLSSCRSPDI